MANYGYGGNNGNYSTTSYGAQGGDGGGFMAGSQSGSQGSPGGNKTYGKDSLRPVTIKQVLEAEQPHPDSEFKIDGTDVSQITFVGQVNSVSSQATNTTFKLDDGTGLLEVKQWADADADPETVRPLPKEGEYVRVWGRLKAFNNKRHLAANLIRPIANHNEINYHLLEATAVHLYFTRGPPQSAGNGANGMFVDGQANGGGGYGQTGGSKKLNVGPMARRVYECLASSPSNNEGLHVNMIANQLGVPASDVFKAGDELLSEGVIFTTVDDETWAVLEY